MTRFYALDAQHNVTPVDATTWGAQFSDVDRRVARTVLGDVTVSTVFLGLDHRLHGDGPPLLFETMVFGGPHDQECWRCSTWVEAEAQHARVVAGVAGVAGEPPFWVRSVAPLWSDERIHEQLGVKSDSMLEGASRFTVGLDEALAACKKIRNEYERAAPVMPLDMPDEVYEAIEWIVGFATQPPRVPPLQKSIEMQRIVRAWMQSQRPQNDEVSNG